MSLSFVDPLSFTQTANTSLADLLREALLRLKCPAEKLYGFDQFPTITITLENLPAINISVLDERLWVWSALTGMSQNQIIMRGGEVLLLLSDAMDGVETGQLILGLSEQGAELKALVNPSCLGVAEGFAAVLDGFYGRLGALHKLLIV